MAACMCILVLLTAARTQEREASQVLDANQELAVRNCVYNGSPKVGTSFPKDLQEELEIPEALSDLYRDHPGAVLDLLLRIIDGANPNESVLAAGYAISLQNGPAVGVVCVDMFEKGTYDKVDRSWKTTPRKHWIRSIKKEREREAERGIQIRKQATKK